VVLAAVFVDLGSDRFFDSLTLGGDFVAATTAASAHAAPHKLPI